VSVQRPEFPWERTARVPWEWMRDPRLSLKGKGLLSYLLSHAPGYTVSQGQMVRESTDGRDSVLTGLRELEAAGYLAPRPSRADAPRGNRGQFVEHDYLLQDPAATNPTHRTAPPQVANGHRAENPTVADFPSRADRDGESDPKGKKEEGRKKTQTPAVAAAELFPLEADEQPAPTINQRAKALTDEHYDACGRMENWAAVRGIVVKALTANYDDEAIRKALADLRASGMSVATATLRNALTRPGSGGRGQLRSASGRTHWEPRERGTYTDAGDGTF
jgi:hypothetical protein